MGKGGDETVK